MSTRVWYSRDGGFRHDFEIRANVDMARAEDTLLADVAEECAEDFHSNHDGWEASWPLILCLYASKEGPEVGRFEIDREAQPVFFVRAVATKDAA